MVGPAAPVEPRTIGENNYDRDKHCHPGTVSEWLDLVVMQAPIRQMNITCRREIFAIGPLQRLSGIDGMPKELGAALSVANSILCPRVNYTPLSHSGSASDFNLEKSIYPANMRGNSHNAAL